MQPKRDPNDVRYWPQSEGGTGFNRDGKPRYQYSVLRTRDQHRNLVTDYTVTLPSIVVDPQDYTPDTVRSRARAALLLAVNRLHDAVANDDNTLAVNELTQIAGTLGRISGVQTTTMEVTGSVAHMHLDALREITQRATSRIASPDHAQPDTTQHVIASPSDRVNEDAGA